MPVFMYATCTAYGATESEKDSQDPLFLQDVLREYLERYADVSKSHWSKSLGTYHMTRIQVYFRYTAIQTLTAQDTLDDLKDCYLISTESAQDCLGDRLYKWSEGRLHIPKNQYTKYNTEYLDLRREDRPPKLIWIEVDGGIPAFEEVIVIKWI